MGSELGEDPLEQKRKTRQTSRRISASPDKTKTKVVTAGPPDENVFTQTENGKKNVKGRGGKKLSSQKRVSLSDPDSSYDEEEEDVIPEKTKAKKKDVKPQANKVSMVAAIFRAKK